MDNGMTKKERDAVRSLIAECLDGLHENLNHGITAYVSSAVVAGDAYETFDAEMVINEAISHLRNLGLHPERTPEIGVSTLWAIRVSTKPRKKFWSIFKV